MLSILLEFVESSPGHVPHFGFCEGNGCAVVLQSMRSVNRLAGGHLTDAAKRKGARGCDADLKQYRHARDTGCINIAAQVY